MGSTAAAGQDPAIIKERIRDMAGDRGVRLLGVADMGPFKEPGADIPPGTRRFLTPYCRAVVMGLPWGLDSGRELVKRLEALALEMYHFIWDQGFMALPVHGDEEFDPLERRGFISLKALAREAGLGWQGRSLLIVNPDHGPLHRLIAVMTDAPLPLDGPVRNRCGSCSACVDACPRGALTLTRFEDRPPRRADVLKVAECVGNDSCPHCIEACPWLKK